MSLICQVLKKKNGTNMLTDIALNVALYSYRMKKKHKHTHYDSLVLVRKQKRRHVEFMSGILMRSLSL